MKETETLRVYFSQDPDEEMIKTRNTFINSRRKTKARKTYASCVESNILHIRPLLTNCLYAIFETFLGLPYSGKRLDSINL